MKLKIGIAALLSAALGFVVQGCFAAQPPPQCTVITSIESLGIGPYYGKLDNKVSTGTCDEAPSSDLTNISVSLGRFVKPGDNNFLLAVKGSYLVDVVKLGNVYSGNVNQANDCQSPTAPGACKYCVVGTGAAAVLADGGVAVARFSDGGLDVDTLSDGGVGPARGIVVDADAGLRLSLTNVCKDTDEAIKRVDSSDPNGERIVAFGTYPEYPDKDGICTTPSFDGGVQLLDAVPLKVGSLPQIPLASEWSNFSMVNTSKAPATFFTAKLKMVEGSCTTSYDVTGFWPVVHCETLDETSGDPIVDSNGDFVPNDVACDPSSDYDAGRIYGSGINPAFKPKCSAKLGVCVPTATAADLK